MIYRFKIDEATGTVHVNNSIIRMIYIYDDMIYIIALTSRSIYTRNKGMITAASCYNGLK